MATHRGYSLRPQPTPGSWLVIVSAGVGRQITKVVHAPTEAKAHKAAQKILPELHERADKARTSVKRDRQLNRPDVMTVERLTDQWLQARRVEGRSDTTIAQYETSAARWLPTLGKRAVIDLQPEEIDDWLASLTATPRKKGGPRRPLAASTRRQILGDLHNCLQWGHKRRRLPPPATEHATRPHHTKADETRLPDVDTFREAADALEVIGSDAAGMALVAMGLGLREGEVCGLRWSDIDVDSVRVAGALKRDGSWGETKGRRARTVPLSATARRGLAIAERLGHDSSPWVWPKPNDPTVARRPDWLSRQWATLAPVLGLDLTYHGLRHAFGSLLLNEKTPLPVVSRLMGHADTRVTSEVYAHVIGEFDDDVMGPIDRAFGSD